jgi:phage tail sheath protein FI
VAEALRVSPTLPGAGPAETAIEPLETSVTAFIGRTLRGPLSAPTTIDSFKAYERQFGGLWQPSTLSYAVEQYFEQGGRAAIIVRVASGARAPSLQLPTADGMLRLRGVAPGSREYLRASVDYDGIATEESDRFNIVLQRVRAPHTEQIEAQEIYRRVSLRPDSDRYLGTVLAASRLARLEAAPSARRAERTGGATVSQSVGYVDSSTDGDDGVALNDYDIIGNAETGSGLFALSQAREHFSMLCVPPLDREHDIGYSTLVVAGRICRQRHSLLIVDPPSGWNSIDAAIAGLRDWPFQNADACMYFPRVITLDRLRGQLAEFAGCGAVAGLIAYADARCPVWGAAAGEESLLRSPLRPAVNVGERERERLLHYGVNTLRTARPAGQSTHWPTTLVPELNARPEKRILAVRRLGHYVVSSVVRGTRWTLLEATDPTLWLRLRVQVEAFLESVAVQGALVGDRPEDGYFVICDERLNRAVGQHPRELNLLFGIAALRPREFQAWLVTHRAAGSTVRAVSVNRRFTEAVQAQDEIETAILRGVLRDNVLREGVTA